MPERRSTSTPGGRGPGGEVGRTNSFPVDTSVLLHRNMGNYKEMLMPMDQLVADDPVARARALRPELLAAADEIERIQDFPEPLASHLHDARLFQLMLPRSCGRVQAGPITYLRALIEVAQGDGSVAWNMFVSNSSCLLAAIMPLESAKTIYSSPRSVMAWGFPRGQTADAVDGGYKVSGRWDFASGSRQATWMGAHGFVREKDGSLRLNERGTSLIRSWLFPAEQAELLDNWNPVGLRGTCSQSYNVPDVFVPEEFSSTREYPEQRREPGPLYAIPHRGSMRSVWQVWRWGWRAPCWTASATSPWRRRPVAARAWPKTSWCRQGTPGRRRNTARRSPIWRRPSTTFIRAQASGT